MSDPRVRLITEDGRNLATHTADRYDVISVEVGQVFRPGVASFYTAEFYRRARERLTPTGVFSQFVPIGFLRPDQLRMVVRTFLEVFPQSLLWYNRSELLLIGTRGDRLTEQLRRGKGGEDPVPLLETALRWNPENVFALRALGAELRGRGLPRIALYSLERAREIDPTSAETQVELGAALSASGQEDAAVSAYRLAVQLAPANAAAQLGLGVLLLARGDETAGVDHLRIAASLAPHSQPVQNDAAWALATHDTGSDGAAEAVRLAESSVRIAGRAAPEPLDTLAAAYAAAGRFDDARATAREAAARATALGRADLARALATRLELYEAGRPFRDSSSR